MNKIGKPHHVLGKQKMFSTIEGASTFNNLIHLQHLNFYLVWTLNTQVSLIKYNWIGLKITLTMSINYQIPSPLINVLL